MRILVIGGTMFLGRRLVEAALREGHEVTLFHRGRTNPGLFPKATELIGDRRVDEDLAQLDAGEWDAVVDTSGYFPADVRRLAPRLAGRAGRYVFVSSLSVYPDLSHIGMDESAPVAVVDDPESQTDITPENYGALKALCEAEAEKAFPGAAVNVRAGLIVGPDDPSDRFTYWPARADRGGRMLVPGEPNQLAQFIDARDLAAWMLRMCETGAPGVYNANSPAGAYALGDLIQACVRLGGGRAEPVWVDQDFLGANEVAPWSELPVWLPDTPELAGFATTSVDKAVAQGLMVRPIDYVVTDTLAWWRSLEPARDLRAGLSASREAALLAAWEARV